MSCFYTSLDASVTYIALADGSYLALKRKGKGDYEKAEIVKTGKLLARDLPDFVGEEVLNSLTSQLKDSITLRERKYRRARKTL